MEGQRDGSGPREGGGTKLPARKQGRAKGSKTVGLPPRAAALCTAKLGVCGHTAPHVPDLA